MLSHRQQKFLTCYLTSANAAKAAKEAGIAVSTAYKYLSDHEFNAAISRCRAAELRKSTAYLQSKLQMCSEKLINIIESESVNASIKVQAIQTVYSNIERAVDRIDILDRLDALERRQNEY